MKRKNFVLCLLLCMICGSLFWVFHSRSPIDKSTYDAIELRMPENDAMMLVPIPHRSSSDGKIGEKIVRKIRAVSSQSLGEAGTAHFKSKEVVNEQTADGTYVYFEAATKRELAKVRFWDTDDYSLVVLFSPDGKVMGKTIYQMVYGDTWWDALLFRYLKF